MIHSAVLDNINEAVICITADDKVHAFNRAATRLWGLEADAVLGQCVQMLFPGAGPLRKALAVGRGRRVTGTAKGGEPLTLDLSVSASDIEVDGKRVVVRTVVARDIAGDVERRKLDAVINAALNSIITCLPDGTIESVNKSAAQVFLLDTGNSEKQVGNVAELLAPAEGKAQGGKWMRDFLHRSAGTVQEMQGRRGDGSTFPMRMSVSEVEVEDGLWFTVILRDVTSEKEAAARVEAEQRKTRAIMNSALNAIITSDGDGTIDLFNTSAGKVFGYSDDEVEHMNLSKLIVMTEGTASPGAWMRDFLHRSAGTVQEMQGRRGDGSTFPMRMSVSEVEVDGSNFYTAILRDITKEKEAAARVEAEQRKTRAIMNSALNAIITSDGDGTIDLFNTSAGKVFRYTEGEVEHMNLSKLIVPNEGTASPGAWMRDFLHRSAGTVQEMQGRRGDGSTFPMRMSVSEVEVDGSNFYTAILRDITKEKEAAARVEAEQRKTRAIMNSALNAIITSDGDGTIDLFNTSAGKVFGYSDDEVEHMNLSKLIVMTEGTASPGAWMRDFLHRSAGTVQEMQGRRGDGSTFPMRMSVSEVEVDGSNFYTAILRDITKEKEAAARVEAEQRKTRAIMNSALNAIITSDGDGTIDLFNTSAGKVFGYSDDEVEHMNLSKLIVMTEGTASPGAWMRDFLHRSAGTVQEMQGRRGDGSTFPMRMSVSEVEVDGSNFYTAILRDITKEKEAAARIEGEQRKTRAIINTAMNAIITCDERGSIDMFNKSAGKVFRYTEDEVEHMNLRELIIFDEQPIPVPVQRRGSGSGRRVSRSSMDEPRGIEGFLLRSANTVQELKGRRGDGSTFPIRMSVSQVEVEERPIYTAILRDITKEKEHLLVASEKSRLAAILNTTVDGVIVTETNGTINTFNSAAERIFGWKAEEVLGQNISIMMPHKHGRRHQAYMDRFTQRGGSGPGGGKVVGHGREIEAMRKDGSFFMCYLSISEVVLHDGTKQFTGTVRDITNEQLLMNMLPASIAARLKAKETPINDGFENVSILFSDVVGFTEMSSHMAPMEVVTFLNDVFSLFDELADLYGLEKIKTIGDCYMVVCGLPEAREDHARRMACFALDLLLTLKTYNQQEHPRFPLDMRVGINCGPVVAGVVGKRKFLYDIWGDSVNLASRMESSGKAGLIQVTDDYHNQTNEWFTYEERGTIDVKGKGPTKTWWLKGPRTERLAELLELACGGGENLDELLMDMSEQKQMGELEMGRIGGFTVAEKDELGPSAPTPPCAPAHPPITRP